MALWRGDSSGQPLLGPGPGPVAVCGAGRPRVITVTTTPALVLIHGGWQSGWCWDGVRDVLVDQGHDVVVPTWLGSPDDPPPTGAGASVDGAGDHVAQQVLEAHDGDVVLIGHSGGGPVAQRAAEALGPRVRRLVFLNAWVLHDGETIADLLPAVAAVAPVAAAREDHSIPMPVEQWRDQLLNGAPEEVVAATAERLVPLPWAHFAEPVHLPHAERADVPTSYVFLDDDIAVDPAVYRQMAERLPQARIERAPGSHQAMLTHPRELAAALVRAAA